LNLGNRSFPPEGCQRVWGVRLHSYLGPAVHSGMGHAVLECCSCSQVTMGHYTCLLGGPLVHLGLGGWPAVFWGVCHNRWVAGGHFCPLGQQLSWLGGVERDGYFRWAGVPYFVVDNTLSV
jgi:hypothetical protein